MIKRKDNTITLTLFVALFVFFVFYQFTLQPRLAIKFEARAHDGVFDFSQIDFNEDKLNGLEGKVEFYWKQLLTPSDFQSTRSVQPDGYIDIPGIWNGYKVKGEELGGYGFATYHFKLILPEDDLYGLKIKEFDDAYKIWVNGKLLTETGIVGRTKDTMKPSWQRKTLFFQTNNKVADVVLQISNFQHRKGGPEDVMVFGKSEYIYQYRNTLSAMELFLVGVLLVLATYHLIYFIFRTTDKTSLYFSIICILMMIRLTTTGEKMLIETLPRIDWLTAVKLEYLSYKLVVPFFLLFLYQFYPKEFSMRVIKWSMYLAAAFSLAVIFLPPVIFTYTPVLYQLVILVLAIYALVCLSNAALHRKENSRIFLTSYAVFFLVVINDILYYNKIISTGFLMPYGVFVLAYAQSFVLAKNASITFLKSERLTEELNQSNVQLEQKVHERTEQIKIQKDELEKQANILRSNNAQLQELNAFKENLTDMIIHDLKSPLNIVLNFSKDERVVFAGNQMLNLVHNLLDVQRYENSVMKLNLEPVSVHDLIQKAVFQMNFLIKEKNIQLSIKKSKDYLVLVDHEIIHRVFVNLLSNALKFTPSKGLISIFIKEKLNSVTICFSDSGPGIPKDQKNVIFEKFGQFIVQRAGRSGSTGLGLTFCKMAAEAHKGKVDFTSVLGKGATFCVTLPKEGIANKHAKAPIKLDRNFINLKELTFTKKERLIMAGIVQELSSSKIYEIGKIKRLLQQIDPEQTDQLKLWISELQKAMLNSDNELFAALIEKIK